MLHLAWQPGKLVGEPQRKNARFFRTRLPKWQSVCIALYALFWGFGLPFICFGAIAEPGHPHALPHFVFAEPTPREFSNLAVRAIQTTHANDVVSVFYNRYLKPIGSRANGALSTTSGSKTTLPAGRSTGSLALFDLLTLTMLCIWAISRVDRRHFVFFNSRPFPESIVVSLPLPPPRFLIFSR